MSFHPQFLLLLWKKVEKKTITKLVSKRGQGINEQQLKTELMFHRLRKKSKKSRGGWQPSPPPLYVSGLIDKCINLCAFI